MWQADSGQDKSQNWSPPESRDRERKKERCRVIGVGVMSGVKYISSFQTSANQLQFLFPTLMPRCDQKHLSKNIYFCHIHLNYSHKFAHFYLLPYIMLRQLIPVARHSYPSFLLFSCSILMCFLHVCILYWLSFSTLLAFYPLCCAVSNLCSAFGKTLIGHSC